MLARLTCRAQATRQPILRRRACSVLAPSTDMTVPCRPLHGSALKAGRAPGALKRSARSPRRVVTSPAAAASSRSIPRTSSAASPPGAGFRGLTPSKSTPPSCTTLLRKLCPSTVMRTSRAWVQRDGATTSSGTRTPAAVFLRRSSSAQFSCRQCAATRAERESRVSARLCAAWPRRSWCGGRPGRCRARRRLSVSAVPRHSAGPAAQGRRCRARRR